MHTFMVLYNRVPDVTAFARYYREVHLPLARNVEGIQNIRYAVDVAGIPGESRYIAVFSADFESEPAMFAALESPSGAAAYADIANFATSGFELLHFAGDPG
jgi:uncharacterized protein (TIGR02118 family)